MINNEIKYEELLKIVSKHLDKVDNMAVFCDKHNLNRFTVSRIHAKRDKKQYTRYIIRLLDIFGYCVTKENNYIVTRKP